MAVGLEMRVAVGMSRSRGSRVSYFLGGMLSALKCLDDGDGPHTFAFRPSVSMHPAISEDVLQNDVGGGR